MCSSRLALDKAGQPVAIATTADPFTAIGHRFLVLNVFSIGWFEARGRPPTPRERTGAREPYRSAPQQNKPAEVPDDELSDAEAVRAVPPTPNRNAGPSTSSLLPPNLQETRRRVAADLDEQVAEATAETSGGDAPHWLRLNAQELRGLPAIGKLSAGSAIAGTRPGENLGLFDDDE